LTAILCCQILLTGRDRCVLRHWIEDSPYQAQASGLVTSQINNTLQSAVDLAFRLGGNASTAALSTVATGYYGLGDIAGSQKLLELAPRVARSANDESLALRNLG
jgi:hypothetical protein